MPHPTEPVAVRHPDLGAMVVLDPGHDYAPSDVLVKTYPQFFGKGEAGTRVIESVEVATADPGQKRTRTKPAKS
jgi:hypothetical protein